MSAAERELHLIRHGRVDHSSQAMRETPRGMQWDPPLGDRGREQARHLAARLLVLGPPAALVISPFRRCVETIAPYVEATGIEPSVVEDLGEVYLGQWEGSSFEQIIQHDEELAERFRMHETIPFGAGGGENGQEFRARVRPAVEGVIDSTPEGNIVVVAHGGAINAYINPLLAFEHDMLFVPENTSFNTVLIDGVDRRVKFLNDVRHLSSPDLFQVTP